MNGDQNAEKEQMSESEQQYQPPRGEEGLQSFPSPFGEKRNDVEDNKMWAILAYLFIFSLVTLFMKRESSYAQYHAKQGLLLFGTSVVYSVLGMILSLFLENFIGFLLLLYWVPGSIAIFVLFVLGIMNASGGQTKPLPLLGKFAQGLNV